MYSFHCGCRRCAFLSSAKSQTAFTIVQWHRQGNHTGGKLCKDTVKLLRLLCKVRINVLLRNMYGPTVPLYAMLLWNKSRYDHEEMCLHSNAFIGVMS